ncbi:hypothetical protein NPIL_86801 [Nephila pilipes]|uniref:Uncharacterized protein n=1 Tax=Nephila pilipes TaxID=299642 RepID=A0A8X6IEZ2_NEPPI|nr:hypothetical protein NPIL_86801 [Nephila pilipes]
MGWTEWGKKQIRKKSIKEFLHLTAQEIMFHTKLNMPSSILHQHLSEMLINHRFRDSKLLSSPIMLQTKHTEHSKMPAHIRNFDQTIPFRHARFINGVKLNKVYDASELEPICIQ